MAPAQELLVENTAAPTTKRVRIRKFPVRRLPQPKEGGEDESGELSPALDSSPTGVDAVVFSRCSISPSSADGAACEKVLLYEEDAAPVVKMTTRTPTHKRFKAKNQSQPQLTQKKQQQLLQQQPPRKQQQQNVKLIDDFRVSYLKKAVRLQNETLRDFLGRRDAPQQQRHLTWQKLLEAAQSLEELHLQDIVHGRLQCRNILISTDGSQRARVRNFGALLYNRCFNIAERPSSASSSSSAAIESYAAVDDHTARWIAPECLDGAPSSPESDIFSLGMCILEAVTLTDPWGAVSSDVARVLVSAGRLPTKPSAFAQHDQWELVERMCAREPSQRLSLASVLKHLRRFAEQEQRVRFKVQRDAPTVLYCG